MFGLGFLIIILLYICPSKIVAKYIKKGTTSSLIYWVIVVLIPTWFFVGHYIYPSYFKYQALCQSEVANNYTYERNRESISDKEWLVPNRLVKRLYINVDSSGNVVHESISFSFYPYGSKAEIMGFASGSAPRMSCYGESNLKDFIKQHINISPVRQQSVIQEAEIVSGSGLIDSAFINRGRPGDTVSCNLKVVGKGYNDSPGLDVSYLIDGAQIERKHNIEKTICTNEYIFIVKTPMGKNNFFQVYIFDYQGINIRNLKFPIPSRSWKGYPRKPLIYFNLNQDTLTVGIEEFGKDIEPEKIYYNVTFDQSDKSSSSDTVNNTNS